MQVFMLVGQKTEGGVGGDKRFDVGRYESDGNDSKLNLLGVSYCLESMLLSVDGFYTDDLRVKK